MFEKPANPLSENSFLRSRILHPRRLKAMKMRSLIETGVREYFLNLDFLEVRTPLLVKSPGMEAHIDPFELSNGSFLPSSPELSMKKLLVGGLERIFQLGPAFRDEVFSKHHRPEFTMLEFYRANSSYLAIQNDFEKLVEFLALKIRGKALLDFEGKEIDVSTPWPRFRINDLFIKHLGIDLSQEKTRDQLFTRAKQIGLYVDDTDSWDEIYFRIWLEHIEKSLPSERAILITHYPASQAALANIEICEDGPWAKRFEAYIGGIELCNGFDELTDAAEQRTRFNQELALRRQLVGTGKAPISPIDEEFLLALEEGMPPSGGVAVGIDRLIMLFADEPDIEYCFWLNPFDPKVNA